MVKTKNKEIRVAQKPFFSFLQLLLRSGVCLLIAIQLAMSAPSEISVVKYLLPEKTAGEHC